VSHSLDRAVTGDKSLVDAGGTFCLTLQVRKARPNRGGQYQFLFNNSRILFRSTVSAQFILEIGHNAAGAWQGFEAGHKLLRGCAR
jgi:hypothetical protein